MSKEKNDNKLVTIVCCYNDSKQYERLCSSLKKQTMPYELIGVDNRGNRYSSCSSALNSALDEVKTEYLIYSHQDIELPEEDVLEQFVTYLDEIDEGDILGVAGAAETAVVLKNGGKADRQRGERRIGDKDGTCVISYTKHGADGVCAGEIVYDGLLECDSIDECFFGARTETLKKEPLDEKLCDNWHLYGVERCLRARLQGNHVWVCDVPFWHHSTGTISHSYNENFRRIAKHYARFAKGKLEWIRTVCGSARVDWFHRNAFYYKRELLFLLHRM